MLYDAVTKLTKIVIALSLLITATACVHSNPRYETPIPAIDTTLFGKRPNNIPTINDIFSVNSQHANRFLSFYKHKKNAHIDPHRRVANYVEMLLEDFEYNHQTLKTNTALSQLSGDCMTLATLTTALAHLVEINTNYRYINNDPYYDRVSPNDNLLLCSIVIWLQTI